MNSLTRSASPFGLLLVAIPSCTGPYPPPPDTRIEPVVDVFHGIEFVDDYRWLEDQESAETRAWIDGQNAYAEAVASNMLSEMLVLLEQT